MGKEIKTGKILWLCIFAVMIFVSKTSTDNISAAGNTHEAEGYFYIGLTGCTIQWDAAAENYKVYWDESGGYTVLRFVEQNADGNYVYDELSPDGSTRIGTFIFRAAHENGFYTGIDGRRQSVKR